MTVAESTLTKRQRQVVELLIEGNDIPEVARQLGCSPATVRKHIELIAERMPGKYTPIRRILIYGPSWIAEGG
jgi:DNA-binding CsgD family transcriptional regulator